MSEPPNSLAKVAVLVRALPGLVTALRDTMESGDLLTPVERSERITALIAQIETEQEGMRALGAIAPEELPKAYEVLRSLGVTVPHHLTGALFHVERMSWQGMKPKQIADRIGIDPAMLKYMEEKYPDVHAAMIGGAARAADELSAAVMRKALGPEGADLAMKLLKSKHDFEAPAPAAPPPTVAVQVNVDARPAPIDAGHATSLAARQRALMRGEAPAAGRVIEADAG